MAARGPQHAALAPSKAPVGKDGSLLSLFLIMTGPWGPEQGEGRVSGTASGKGGPGREGGRPGADMPSWRETQRRPDTKGVPAFPAPRGREPTGSPWPHSLADRTVLKGNPFRSEFQQSASVPEPQWSFMSPMAFVPLGGWGTRRVLAVPGVKGGCTWPGTALHAAQRKSVNFLMAL